MKKLIASLIAVTAAVSTLQAHCGTCSTSEGADSHHADAHASCTETKLSSYFSIQKALAGDDLPAAQAAATSLHDSIAKSECAADDGGCCSEVDGACDTIAKAEDISVARKAFQAFSDILIAQLESHGSETAAYQMHCPMAFQGKGGSWLQETKDLRNPYYGSMMLTCGMQTAAHGSAEKETDHSGHQH